MFTWRAAYSGSRLGKQEIKSQNLATAPSARGSAAHRGWFAFRAFNLRTGNRILHAVRFIMNNLRTRNQSGADGAICEPENARSQPAPLLARHSHRILGDHPPHLVYDCEPLIHRLGDSVPVLNIASDEVVFDGERVVIQAAEPMDWPVREFCKVPVFFRGRKYYLRSKRGVEQPRPMVYELWPWPADLHEASQHTVVYDEVHCAHF